MLAFDSEEETGLFLDRYQVEVVDGKKPNDEPADVVGFKPLLRLDNTGWLGKSNRKGPDSRWAGGGPMHDRCLWIVDKGTVQGWSIGEHIYGGKFPESPAYVPHDSFASPPQRVDALPALPIVQGAGKIGSANTPTPVASAQSKEKKERRKSLADKLKALKAPAKSGERSPSKPPVLTGSPWAASADPASKSTANAAAASMETMETMETMNTMDTMDTVEEDDAEADGYGEDTGSNDGADADMDGDTDGDMDGEGHGEGHGGGGMGRLQDTAPAVSLSSIKPMFGGVFGKMAPSTQSGGASKPIALFGKKLPSAHAEKGEAAADSALKRPQDDSYVSLAM